MINKLRKFINVIFNKYPYNKKNCIIDSTCSFSGLHGLVLGEWIHVGPRSYFAADGGVTIGSGTIVSSWVTILSSNHDYGSNDCVPYGRGNIFKPVSIGRAVWIGYGVTILPGVEIGDGAIVGAGSVVVKNVDAGAIVAGNPAKIVGFRSSENWKKLIDDEKFLLKIKLRG